MPDTTKWYVTMKRKYVKNDATVEVKTMESGYSRLEFPEQ